VCVPAPHAPRPRYGQPAASSVGGVPGPRVDAHRPAFYTATRLETAPGPLITRDHRNTVGWTVKESVRAKLRLAVKRVLRRHGYPPDKQEQAVETVIHQAELLSEEWAA
jgi:hypothetical protein